MNYKVKKFLVQTCLILTCMGMGFAHGASGGGNVLPNVVSGNNGSAPTSSSVAVQAQPQMSVFDMGLENFRLRGQVDALKTRLDDEEQARSGLNTQVETQGQKISTLEQQERVHTAAEQQQALVNAALKAQAKVFEEDLQKKTRLMQVLMGPLQLLADDAKQKLHTEVSTIITEIDGIMGLRSVPAQDVPHRVGGLVCAVKARFPNVDTSSLNEISGRSGVCTMNGDPQSWVKPLEHLKLQVQTEAERLLRTYDLPVLPTA